MNYYYSTDGTEVVGPYSLDDLKIELFSGSLPPTTQVCAEGTETWQTLVSLVNPPLKQPVPPPALSPQIHSPKTVSQPVATPKPVATTTKKKRSSAATLLLLAILFGAFYFLCGIFVIQPIGAIPDGATIVYWRVGLRLPFISSADGLLETSGAGVSLLGRGIFLAGIADKIKDRKIVNFPYSKTLYLWSTGGKEYDR